MGIKFHCPNGHRLNVKSFLAGKTGICPKCGVRVEIPFDSGGQAAPNGPRPPGMFSVGTGNAAGNAIDAIGPPLPPGRGAAPAADPIEEAPAANWYVRAAAGGEYGPATGEIMRAWLAEGRVTADSWVWRDGWPDWRQAGQAFPTLPGAHPPAAPRPVPVAPAAPVAAAAPEVFGEIPLPASTSWEQPSADPNPGTQNGEFLGAPTMRRAMARESFRRNMMLATAVLIGAVLILVGVLVYVLLVRPQLNELQQNMQPVAPPAAKAADSKAPEAKTPEAKTTEPHVPSARSIDKDDEPR